jgi:hypothetical protein
MKRTVLADGPGKDTNCPASGEVGAYQREKKKPWWQLKEQSWMLEMYDVDSLSEK